MKIFITGVAGFLGSHLADLMISEGHTVAGNDNMIGGYTDNVPQDVEFHQVDCCNLENMTKAMDGCDIVYHTAATAYEGLSVFSPVLVTRNIFEASVTTITAAIRNKVKRIVYCSSMVSMISCRTKKITNVGRRIHMVLQRRPARMCYVIFVKHME